MIGVMASIGWFTFTIMAEPVGSVINRIGERKAVLYGGVLDVVGFLMIFASNSIYVLAAAMVVEGLGSTFFWSAARTHIANLSQGRTGTAFGAYVASWGIGWSIGPLLGGTLAYVADIRTPFIFAAAIMAVTVVALGQVIPADKKDRHIGKVIAYELRGGFLRDGISFLKGAPTGTKRILLLQMLMYSALEIVITFAPLYFIGLNHVAIGAMIFINSIVFAISSVLWGTLSDRFRKPMFIVLGFAFCSGTILLLLGSFNFIYALLLMGFFGLALALIEPVTDAMLNDRIERRNRGIANGISQASYGLGASIGPILGGVAATLFGFGGSFIAAIVLCVFGGLVGLSIRK
jgi:MFS family permease